MELLERDYNSLTEDEKRLYQRSLTKNRGLYNGESAGDIEKRKGLRYREDIYMGSDELTANLFRISQTEQKIRNDNVD